MWPALLAVGVVAAVLFSAKPARADTFRKEKRPIDKQTWHGCGDPPADAKPRPRFKCGDDVIDTSTGKPRKRRVTELAGSKNRDGSWTWVYVFDDGTAASSATLKRSEAQ